MRKLTSTPLAMKMYPSSSCTIVRDLNHDHQPILYGLYPREINPVVLLDKFSYVVTFRQPNKGWHYYQCINAKLIYLLIIYLLTIHQYSVDININLISLIKINIWYLAGQHICTLQKHSRIYQGFKSIFNGYIM